MATPTSLAPDIRSQLENVRRILDLSQGKLAQLAGISQANVSNCLQGKPVRVHSLRRLLSALALRVASASDKGFSGEQLQELRKAVDAASRAVGGSAEPPTYFARPGAPMPDNAANRLRRKEDKQLLDALDDAPFTAAIVGPPECGKTTTLQLLLEEAPRRGFAVVDFDSRLIPDPSDSFLPKLAEEVGRIIGEKPPEDLKSPLDLVRFLREARSHKSAPPLLIAVDHTEAVGEAVEALVQACRALDAQKSRTQMSWVVEAGDFRHGHRLGILSELRPTPMIEMRWLSKAQVEKFADIYDIQNIKMMNELWNWFLGQPALTHIALDRFRELVRDDAQKVEQYPDVIRGEIIARRGKFWRHFRRLRERLEESVGLLRDGESVADFEKRCQKEEINLAERSGLFRPGESSLKMPQFYQHHYSALFENQPSHES